MDVTYSNNDWISSILCNMSIATKLFIYFTAFSYQSFLNKTIWASYIKLESSQEYLSPALKQIS